MVRDNVRVMFIFFLYDGIRLLFSINNQPRQLGDARGFVLYVNQTTIIQYKSNFDRRYFSSAG